MKGTQHMDRLDRRARQSGRDIRRNPRQADNLNLQHLPGLPRLLQLSTTDVLQAQHERAAGDSLLDLLCVNAQLIADRGAED